MDTSGQVPALGGLDGFELWDRTVHAPAHKPVKSAFVSVRVGGFVGISLTCYAMWGEPEACRAMFDPERRRLAFKPCGLGEPNSYFLGEPQKQIPLRNLFTYYDVLIIETRRYYDLRVVDGVLIVDL